jgi:exopolysaccharide biosynthesis predicted pyruvyltransferase EpsI
MGIPHVLVDDRHGKLSSFYETWTRGCPLAAWADTPREAFEHARRLTE